MARLGAATVLFLAGVLAAGCADTSEEVADDEGAITVEGEYGFRYEFPANSIFGQPFAKAFTTRLEKRGVQVNATITPTVQLAVSSPVIEGKVTVGRRGFIIKRPKVIDAEVKASSRYVANLAVDIDVKWSDTTRPDVMRELAGELEEQLNGGKALELATHLGETNIPIRDLRGNVREDLPLKAYYDVAVTCSFDEIAGDVKGQFRGGMRGTVVARGIYNIDGVEQRRFLPDPKKKFEIDTSDFRADPAPTFRYDGPRRHLKGTCAVQPSVVVTFENGTGIGVRVDAESSFETAELPNTPGGEADPWELRATPKVSVWGETDITLPILRSRLNLEKRLFLREFPEVRAAISDLEPDAPAGAEGGCFSKTLQRTMPELSCVQSNETSLWYQCNDGKWYRGGDSTTGPYGACSSSHPL